MLHPFPALTSELPCLCIAAGLQWAPGEFESMGAKAPRVKTFGSSQVSEGWAEFRP